jgi:hypothetical protein
MNKSTTNSNIERSSIRLFTHDKAALLRCATQAGLNDAVHKGSRAIVRIATTLCLTFAALAGSANAGSSTGTVTQIMVVTGDVVTFSAGVHQGKPACSTAADDWALSLTTASGKAMYALLLSAQSQGKPITVLGTQACTAWPDRETPQYIHLTQ